MEITHIELEAIIARAVCTGIEAYNGKNDTQWVSVKKAKEDLKVSRTTLYTMIKLGDLEVKKIGHRTVITTASINRYLNR